MEKYYDLKCLLKNTKDEKLKIFIYRNSYNELGLSTLCVEKDKEIERLKDDNKYLNKVNINLSSEKNILNSIMKEVRGKLYDLNYKIKEIHNVPFDVSEIFEIIDLLDKAENK